MPPRSRQVAVSSSSAPKRGLVSTLYNEIKSPENASVVRSVAVFAIATAIFASSWAEYLGPPV